MGCNRSGSSKIGGAHGIRRTSKMGGAHGIRRTSEMGGAHDRSETSRMLGQVERVGQVEWVVWYNIHTHPVPNHKLSEL